MGILVNIHPSMGAPIVDSLRALAPGVQVWGHREEAPADAVEAAECWEVALEHRTGPASLIFARQDLPLVRCDAIPWQMFGISMAGWNFIVSLILVGAATWLMLKPR